MPPRLPICTRCLRRLHQKPSLLPPPNRRNYATAAAAITPAAGPAFPTPSPPISLHPPSQPPSHKPASFPKTQLHRTYTSILQTHPLLILFQHNNITTREWTALRRELDLALARADATITATNPQSPPLASSIRLQILRAGIFQSALAVTDFYLNHPLSPNDAPRLHGTSPEAHAATHKLKHTHPLAPLLTGPICALLLPQISPPHLTAALSVLAPERPSAPPPLKRLQPGYFEPYCQSAVQKLVMLGARVEGRVVDTGGVRWVGGLGGLEALRAEVVGLLMSGGVRLVGSLGGVAGGLGRTLEGLRGLLEGKEKGEGKGEGGGE